MIGAFARRILHEAGVAVTPAWISTRARPPLHRFFLFGTTKDWPKPRKRLRAWRQ